MMVIQLMQTHVGMFHTFSQHVSPPPYKQVHEGYTCTCTNPSPHVTQNELEAVQLLSEIYHNYNLYSEHTAHIPRTDCVYSDHNLLSNLLKFIVSPTKGSSLSGKFIKKTPGTL